MILTYWPMFFNNKRLPYCLFFTIIYKQNFGDFVVAFSKTIRFDPENPYSRRREQYENWKAKKKDIGDPNYHELSDQDKECPLIDRSDVDYDDMRS